MHVPIRRAEPARSTQSRSLTELVADIGELVDSEYALLSAAKFARSVIDANGTCLPSQRVALSKLDAAIALAEARRS